MKYLNTPLHTGRFSNFFTRSFTILTILLILCAAIPQPAQAASGSFVVLSRYSAQLKIGDSFRLLAFTSDGSLPRFQSSNSRVASVTSLGSVTAHKGGSCNITVKTGSFQTACRVKVDKTQIILASKNISIENGESASLKAITSNHSTPAYSSSRKSIAIVDDNGVVTGCKPGNAVITVKADDTKVQCRVKVKKPAIRLNKTSARLYRCQSLQLLATVSSGMEPVWKSSSAGVAYVDDKGLITARKHGTAYITASVDGVTKTCKIVVQPPVIKLNAEHLTLKAGERYALGIQVSSGNTPSVRSSKPSVASVDLSGNITARSPGKTTITVSEDGAREQCLVSVIK